MNEPDCPTCDTALFVTRSKGPLSEWHCQACGLLFDAAVDTRQEHRSGVPWR